MKKIITTSLLIATSITTQAEEKRHAEAHVHGLNNVKMVFEKDQLSVMYQMPMAQLNSQLHHDDHDDHEEGGFVAFLEGIFSHDEHDHDKHDEEHEKEYDHDYEEHGHEGHDDDAKEPENLAQKMQELKDHEELFVLSESAQCNMASFKSELHSVSTESTHKDVELSYTFKCNNPGNFNSVEFSAFKHFELDIIAVDAIINNKAISKRVEKKDSKIIW